MFRLGAFLLLLAGCSSPGQSSPEQPSAEPRIAPPQAPAKHVVLVTVDTLRADVLGAYGGPARTPELDRWAEEGLRFERAYSAAMLTNPSHASILTSLYPRDHGVYSNQSGISDDLRTLPRELRKAGFRAGAVVAFPHLNGNVANFARGFDRFVPGTREERRASEQVELALKTVDALAADRLFLWLHISDPHAPYEPEGAVREVQPPTTPTQQAAAKAPGFQRNNPWFKSAFRRFAHTEVFYDRYVAEVEAVDRALVELREALQAKGIWDEALVVLTSDHGENFGEHDLWFHHGGLYDPTVHVPLIVRGPRIPRRVDSAPIEHVDIAPTVLDALGMPRWEPMRGDSVLSSSDGQRYAFSEHMMAQAVSVRDDEWLAILHRRNTGQFPSYPLKSGERELWRRNPSGDLLRVERGDYPVAAARLDSAIDEYLGAGSTLHARRARGQDRESLRALGYIE